MLHTGSWRGYIAVLAEHPPLGQPGDMRDPPPCVALRPPPCMEAAAFLFVWSPSAHEIPPSRPCRDSRSGRSIHRDGGLVVLQRRGSGRIVLHRAGGDRAGRLRSRDVGACRVSCSWCPPRSSGLLRARWPCRGSATWARRRSPSSWRAGWLTIGPSAGSRNEFGHGIDVWPKAMHSMSQVRSCS